MGWTTDSTIGSHQCTKLSWNEFVAACVCLDREKRICGCERTEWPRETMTMDEAAITARDSRHLNVSNGHVLISTIQKISRDLIAEGTLDS